MHYRFVKIIGIILFVSITLISAGTVFWQKYTENIFEQTKDQQTVSNSNSEVINEIGIVPLPVEDANVELPAIIDEAKIEEPTPLPAEFSLAVPFTPQAPHANWDLPYQEACEEASVLMTARFLLGRTIDGPDDADTAILELVNFNTDQLGQPIDTTAAETARIIEEFYDLDTEVIYDFSWEDVKHALVAGYPIIMPAAGQQLGNPNFTAPGPRYHMLVIKGYTPDHIITNDPGTRNGKDYLYNYDTLYTAAHDWNGGAVESGQKAIIIVKPSVSPAE